MNSQGPSSTMQCALPQLLQTTPLSFFSSTLSSLQRSGQLLYDRLSQISGLVPLLPQGAMYLMCGGLENFGFENDKEFVETLMREENILILPGTCFQYVSLSSLFPLPSSSSSSHELICGVG